jgi:hypothetical protein
MLCYLGNGPNRNQQLNIPSLADLTRQLDRTKRFPLILRHPQRSHPLAIIRQRL